MKSATLRGALPLALISLLLLSGCDKKKQDDSASSFKLPVTVAQPVVQDVVLTSEFPGYLQALNTVNLVARVSGRLEQVAYTPGARVSKGQTLFVIEPTTYQDNVKQAQAALDEGRATLNYAKANYERTKEAYKSNAVSEIAVIQAQSNYEQAKASLANYEAALTTAQTNLGYCYVRAPFAGRVTKNVFDAGNYVSGGEAPTLATIYQDDQIYVNFNVSDAQYLAMELDKLDKHNLPELTIVADAAEGLPEYKAKLDYSAPNVVLSTGTVAMRGLIDNKDGYLRDGLYVKVIMPYGEDPQALLIPDASIGSDQLGRYVYIVNDSARVETRRIEVGQLVGETMRLVTSGLKPTDRYVVDALLKVRPGMEVNPVPQGAKADAAKASAVDASKASATDASKADASKADASKATKADASKADAAKQVTTTTNQNMKSSEK